MPRKRIYPERRPGYAKWVESGLSDLDISARELSRKVGVTPKVIYDVLNSETDILLALADDISQAIGKPVPTNIKIREMPALVEEVEIVGRIGEWFEETKVKTHGKIAVPIDDRVPNAERRAFKLDQSSQLLGYKPDDVLLTTEIKRDLRLHDIVIAKKKGAGKFRQHTVLQMRKDANGEVRLALVLDDSSPEDLEAEPVSLVYSMTRRYSI